MSSITLNEHKELNVYTDSHSQQASCQPLPALLSSFSPPPAAFSPLPREDDGPQAQHAYKVIHKSITGGAPVIFSRPTHFLLSSSSCFLLLSSSSFLFLSLSISSWILRSLAASSSRRRRSRSYVTHTPMTSS